MAWIGVVWVDDEGEVKGSVVLVGSKAREAEAECKK